MNTKITEVGQNPLTLLLEAAGSDSVDRATNLSKAITELKGMYPEKTFQLLPHLYNLHISNMTSGGSSLLTAILAVEN